MAGAAHKVALRIEQDMSCPDCGYNLRGLRLDVKCPECGRPTIDTFARPLRATTGVIAEEMVRRSGRLLLAVLGWWCAFRWVAWYAPPALTGPILWIASAFAAAVQLIGMVDAGRLRRQARARTGGSSKPLQDAAGPWHLLCGMATVGGVALMALSMTVRPSMLLMSMLILGSAVSAGGSQLLAAHAAATVLRRSALQAPTTAVATLGVAAAVLIAAVIAPPTPPAIVVALRVLVGVMAAGVWAVAAYLVVGKLHEAQGSVVSINKRRRR